MRISYRWLSVALVFCLQMAPGAGIAQVSKPGMDNVPAAQIEGTAAYL